MTATVAVVGAGLAGLACADRLRRAGVRATLYEASDRVGGRCWTLRGHFAGGRHVERGGQLIDSGHTTLLALARELELELVDVRAAEPPGMMPALFVDGAPYPLHHAFADFARVQPVVHADHLAAGPHTGYQHQSPAGRRLDALSVGEYLDRVVPGGRQSRLGRLLAIAYTWELGADADELSALHLVDLLGCNGPGEFQLLGPADAAYTLRDGCDLLATGLAARTPAAIELGHELVAVRQRADTRVCLTFADGPATREVVVDKAVLALPFSILRTSVDTSRAGFGARKNTAIQSLGMGASARLQLQFDGRPWQAQAYFGASVSDTGYQSCWDETLGHGGEDAILVSLRAGRAVTDAAHGPLAGDGLAAGPEATDKHARRFLDQVAPVFPGAPPRWNGLAAYHDWSRYRWTLGSYAFYRPGQFTAFAGVEREPEGNCHFAGEHTSPDSSGMNGAVESGLRAAGEILDDLLP